MTSGVANARWDRRSFLAGAVSLGALLPAAARAASPLRVLTYTAGEDGMFVNSHLVLGERDAVLIDAQFLLEDARRVVARIKASGRTLSRVFITHTHPDHLFGAEAIRAAFPAARFLATPPTAERWRTIAPRALGFVRPEFGDRSATTPILPEPYGADALLIEGRALPIVDFGPTEDEDSTVLIARENGEVFSGDLLYANTHLFLADRRYDAWRAALDRLQALGVPNARPGHGPAGPTGPLIDANRRYIDRFERITAEAPTADEAGRRLRAEFPSYGGARLLRMSLGGAYAAR